jgi:hypothetical protein
MRWRTKKSSNCRCCRSYRRAASEVRWHDSRTGWLRGVFTKLGLASARFQAPFCAVAGGLGRALGSSSIAGHLMKSGPRPFIMQLPSRRAPQNRVLHHIIIIISGTRSALRSCFNRPTILQRLLTCPTLLGHCYEAQLLEGGLDEEKFQTEPSRYLPARIYLPVRPVSGLGVSHGLDLGWTTAG